MSLPPGFLDELRTRTSLAQVVGRKVTWDTRKSNQGKGDFWAPCPFHQEKTASFHVDDRKGFYHCFGCNAGGDAIKFVQETDNLSFIEAIRFLAQDAGMDVPEADPRERERSDRRHGLSEVMEQAVQFYRLQLNTGAAGPARDYLTGRGLDKAAIDAFEIGFAPPGWESLREHFANKGVSPDVLLACGLVKPSTRGDGKPYDTFRNRIMFPIRDARGRAIAFGGRAMDPNDNAKYLNSPETELFDKGRNLYNLGPARAAAGKGQPLIVAEGYMDVIALSRAGFEGAVAPLGTAVTPEQLQQMWRVAPEPVIALDGDAAGLRAAYRVIDLALPMLAPERALRFVILPEGKDPDDLIRSEGRGRMAELLDNALPLVSLLWQRETEGRVLDSPERKAALDKALRGALMRIGDPSVRRHYTDEVRRLRAELLTPVRMDNGQWSKGPGAGRARRGWMPPRAPVAGTRASLLAQAEGAEDRLREAVILATLVVHPRLISEFEHALEDLDFHHEEYRALADALLRLDPDTADVRATIAQAIGPAPLENLFALRHVQIAPPVRRDEDTEAARLCLREEFAKLDARRGVEKEIAEASEDLDGVADEGLTWRLAQAATAMDRAVHTRGGEKAEYDIAPSGARMDRREREAFEALIGKISRGKGDGPA